MRITRGRFWMAAEVSQRIAEAVAAMVQPLPDRVTRRPRHAKFALGAIMPNAA